MVAEFSLKELKELADDHEIDLSARQLVAVPKALPQIPRLTHIDMSQNKIEVLPIELCNMVKIVRLELASNHLVHLPNEFGQLVHLQHLDLFNNQIEELPLSFANLRSLKYLDLKKNPLETKLEKAAGNCGNAKECKDAATRVVAYVADAKKAMEHAIANEAKTMEKIHAKKAEINQEKKKKNQAKHNEKPSKNVNDREKQQAASNGRSDNSKKHIQHNNHRQEGQEANQSYFIVRMIRFFLRSFLYLAILITAAATLSILLNCVNGGNQIPGSKPLCSDLTKLTQFKKPSDKFLVNIRSTYGTVFKSYERRASPYISTASQTISKLYKDFSKSQVGLAVIKFAHQVHSFTVEHVLLLQRWALQKAKELSVWWSRDGEKIFGQIVETVKVYGTMLVEMAKDLAEYLYHAVLLIVHRIESFIHNWSQNGFSKALETAL